MREDGYCVPCKCDQTGSVYQQCNSEGKCRCQPGVTGDKCDKCGENYYDFSKSGCKSCECSQEGSAFNSPNCHPESGVCVCKDNVEGKQCMECKPGFFNLDLDNEFGCTPCFCYGHSSQCRSAMGYSKYALESSFSKGQEKWRAEDQFFRIVPIKYEAISQTSNFYSPLGVTLNAEQEQTNFEILLDLLHLVLKRLQVLHEVLMFALQR
ncbi:hypothetical protein D910_04857 [Dendroctonus ponderosae]|uniref:Laminin EGF-like domain-containing protein n=1 Tax=Dendroctonus ponderosae TaxID=77166 RepID=U4UBZ2_DENPD|nr:hypothetical protein D910_04857 [Dendroctonus ponderosae]